MKLIEIKDSFNINYGAPAPLILTNDDSLVLLFYAFTGNDPTEKIVKLNFHLFSTYSFGSPNEEGLYKHRYYDLGLRSGGFYEVTNSDLIKKLFGNNEAIDEIVLEGLHHYILTFHDNTFECIADGFDFSSVDQSIYNRGLEVLQSTKML